MVCNSIGQKIYSYQQVGVMKEKPQAEVSYSLGNEPVSKPELSFRGAEAMKNYNSVNFRAEAKSDSLVTNSIKPADGPILYFSDKEGEEFMARAVVINGDTEAFAVSNIKSPSQALIMNRDSFKEYMLENLPEVESRPQKYVDISDKYSQEELVDILKDVGTYMASPFANEYDVKFYSESNTVVINNLNRTNDTTIIEEDGRVKHCGSWHNKEVAPAGSFIYIVEDAMERMDG